ncbi:type II toxin-antitoxin system VapC family toxin [soil metagenome]
MSKILRAGLRGGVLDLMGMTYLLDTDIIIYHLNGVIAAQSLLLRLREDGIAMSAISYMEAVEGFARDSNPAHIRRQFDALAGRIPVLSFSDAEAEQSAYIRAALRQQGRRVRSRALDLMIAATALQHDMTLVTNNPGDYDDIPGLSVEAARIVSDQ